MGQQVGAGSVTGKSTPFVRRHPDARKGTPGSVILTPRATTRRTIIDGGSQSDTGQTTCRTDRNRNQALLERGAAANCAPNDEGSRAGAPQAYRRHTYPVPVARPFVSGVSPVSRVATSDGT